jgi:hypothetical protein
MQQHFAPESRPHLQAEVVDAGVIVTGGQFLAGLAFQAAFVVGGKKI